MSHNLVAYPTTLGDAPSVVIDLLTGTVKDKGAAIHAGYHVVGFALGKLVPDKDDSGGLVITSEAPEAEAEEETGSIKRARKLSEAKLIEVLENAKAEEEYALAKAAKAPKRDPLKVSPGPARRKGSKPTIKKETDEAPEDVGAPDEMGDDAPEPTGAAGWLSIVITLMPILLDLLKNLRK